MDSLRLGDLEKIYAANPAYIDIYAKACLACSEPIEESALIASMSDENAGFGRVQDIPSVIETLVAHGALECKRYVDGVLYEGSMLQLQEDETVPENAKIESFYHASEEGTAVATAYSPDNLIAWLFSEHPDCTSGFLSVLRACQEEGKSTAELQDSLRKEGLLAADPGTGFEKLHASFFTSALEKAGALEWKNREWRTTAAGEHALDVAVIEGIDNR